METTNYRQKQQSHSKLSYTDLSDTANNKNLILLTTQVERLTAALQKKTGEVEMLQNQLDTQKSTQSTQEIEELITTVEEQTKEIEKWAEKYQKLQNQQLLLQQKNHELEQVVSLLQNHTQNEIKSSNSNNSLIKGLSSRKFYQNEVEKKDFRQEQDEYNFIFQQKLQAKQEEINSLRLQLTQMKQESLEEKQLHRELLEAEETRVREQEKKNFQQYKQEVKEQLLLYKNQINALQDMLENKQFQIKQENNEEKIRELNLQVLDKNKKIELLENEIFQKDKQINLLQQQLEKYQREQVIYIKQQQLQKQQTLPSQQFSQRLHSSTNYSLDQQSTNELMNPNSIQDQISATMAQINRSIQQVDQMKQSSTVNQKYYQEQLLPVTSTKNIQQSQSFQSSSSLQDKIKAITQLTQQQNNQNYKFI